MLHSSNNISALVNSGKDSAGKDSEAIREYIGDASNYTLQYVY